MIFRDLPPRSGFLTPTKRPKVSQKRADSRALLRFFRSVKSVTYGKRLMAIRTFVTLH